MRFLFRLLFGAEYPGDQHDPENKKKECGNDQQKQPKREPRENLKLQDRNRVHI